jgi:nucleotide-binding universal stress UspA family protein
MVYINNQQTSEIMKTLNRILFPTDFSEMAKGAYKVALELAQKFGAKVEVLNVFRGDFGVPVPEVMAYEMLEARREEASNRMSKFIALADEWDLSVEQTSLVEMGLPMDVIVDHAKRHEDGIDLIVMGTKGEHNLAEVVFGSVTTNVIRNASCPVLAIPEGTKSGDIRSIAYATDFESDGAEALQDAADIAALFGAQLHCVRVTTDGSSHTEAMAAYNDVIDELDLNVKLAEIGSDTIAHGLDNYVQEQGIDLVLMLRPQRKLFDRIFHRSVTKQVALKTSVPVMVFKEG